MDMVIMNIIDSTLVSICAGQNSATLIISPEVLPRPQVKSIPSLKIVE